ncbi:Chromatin-remodeling ATPase INO80 [Labeo rohita]|uniref:Chromatin-remodeling ATPase INO80 n=1 Tax=Labeo rohita TaxID=84645 RepID=A0ABQ8MKX2_LABRO|nr:Chromatin-remodeling ATPase INO80 [Labeo rohita]
MTGYLLYRSLAESLSPLIQMGSSGTRCVSSLENSRLHAIHCLSQAAGLLKHLRRNFLPSENDRIPKFFTSRKACRDGHSNFLQSVEKLPLLKPKQASSCCPEQQPEPTADGEPAPAVTDEPSPRGATELRITLEPEPHLSCDQVRELATMHVTVDETVERESAEESPAYCTGDLIDFYSEVLLPSSSELPACPEMTMEVALNCLPILEYLSVPSRPWRLFFLLDMLPVLGVTICCVWAAHTIPEPSICHDSSSCHLLPPPIITAPSALLSSAPLSLFPVSPSAHPQPSICVVGLPQVCQYPLVSWLVNPLSPSLASRVPDSASAHRPSGSTMSPSSPPFAVAHQSTSSTRLPRPSGSTLVSHRPFRASGIHSFGFASLLCQAPPPWSSVNPASSWPSGSLSAPRSPEPSAPPWPFRSSPSRPGLHYHQLCLLQSAPWIVSPSSIMASPSIGSTVDHLPGWTLEHF